MFNEEFMDYMGYRNSILEEKIDECLEQVRRGEKEVSFDRDDLTPDELEYIEHEVRRRS